MTDSFSPSPELQSAVSRAVISAELANAHIWSLNEALVLMQAEASRIDGLRGEALARGDVDESVALGYGHGAIVAAMIRVRDRIHEIVRMHNGAPAPMAEAAE